MPAKLAAINALPYCSYYYDTETGFYYLQSRYYDPVTHRIFAAICRYIHPRSPQYFPSLCPILDISFYRMYNLLYKLYILLFVPCETLRKTEAFDGKELRSAGRDKRPKRGTG